VAASLDFGALAAERELDTLGKVFVEPKPFKRLLSGRKIILLGNRGSGKTAAINEIQQIMAGRGSVTISLLPDDFAYELLGQTSLTEARGNWSRQSAYAAAWKYLIYVLAMKGIVKTLPGLKTGASKRVYAYVRDNHRDVDLNPLSSLISYLKRLEKIKVGKYEAEVKARELQRLYRLEELENLLDDVNELAQKTPVYIFIDELDRGWDASPDAVSFVAGLFQAATSISVRTRNIKVLMSLRRELYENIPSLYDDAQKVRDTIELIDWDRDKLYSLICRRIGFTLGRPYADHDALWTSVMPDDVHGSPSFDYLLAYTMHRPRELIQFCTHIRDNAPADRRLPFEESDLLRAAPTYSAERFKDIMAEYRFQYPGLDKVVETFRGCATHLSRAELELYCLELSVGDRRVDQSAAWVLNMDPDRIIEILWQVGFLLMEVAGSSTSLYIGTHEVPTANVRNATDFVVHPMFATYLGCAV